MNSTWSWKHWNNFFKNSNLFFKARIIYQVPVCVRSLSHIQLFVTPWIVAQQAPLSMKFSRQEYWSGLPFPVLGALPDPGTEPVSLESLMHWQAHSLPLRHLGNPLSGTYRLTTLILLCLSVFVFHFTINICISIQLFTHKKSFQVDFGFLINFQHIFISKGLFSKIALHLKSFMTFCRDEFLPCSSTDSFSPGCCSVVQHHFIEDFPLNSWGISLGIQRSKDLCFEKNSFWRTEMCLFKKKTRGLNDVKGLPL